MLKITRDNVKDLKQFVIVAEEPIFVESVQVDKKSKANILYVYRLKDMNSTTRESIGIIKSKYPTNSIILNINKLKTNPNEVVIEVSEPNISIDHVELKNSTITYIDLVTN